MPPGRRYGPPRMPRSWAIAVAVLAAFGAGEGAVLGATAGAVAAIAGGLVVPVPLALSPRRPLVAGVAVLALLVLAALTGAQPGDGLMPLGAILAAAVGAGRWLTPGRAANLRAAALGVAAIATSLAVYGASAEQLRATPFSVAFVGAAFGVGRVLRARAAEHADLHTRRERLERERAAEVAAAVAAERERVAAELHAIIATSVRRVAADAARAEAELDERPEDAVETLRAVRASASSALVETRRLLGLLRADPADYAPQPGLGTLAEHGRARGVDVRIAGSTDALPAGLELAVFRIVEEALAAVPPAARPSVRVDVERTRTHLAFTIAADAERRPWGDADPALAGMRERARVYGGELRPEGDGEPWLLRGRLPLGRVPA